MEPAGPLAQGGGTALGCGVGPALRILIGRNLLLLNRFHEKSEDETARGTSTKGIAIPVANTIS
jgi:hypothetical protein